MFKEEASGRSFLPLYQVQIQLALSKCADRDFVVWTKREYVTERILKEDRGFFMDKLGELHAVLLNARNYA